MTIKEMENKALELKDLEKLAEEVKAEMEAIKDELKAELGDRETVSAGAFKISYKAVTSHRVDTTALKRELPEIAARYTTETTTRRFTIT